MMLALRKCGVKKLTLMVISIVCVAFFFVFILEGLIQGSQIESFCIENIPYISCENIAGYLGYIANGIIAFSSIFGLRWVAEQSIWTILIITGLSFLLPTVGLLILKDKEALKTDYVQ